MSRHFLRASLLVASLSFAALPAARAQNAAPTAPLSLEECIARAVKKNFDLEIQGYSTEVAKDALNVAKASFDPIIIATGNRSLSQSASTTSTLDGTTAIGPRADNTSGSIGVNQLLPQTNGTLGLSAGVNRAATNSSFTSLNPAYGNGIT